nr:hypothetical protein [Tanacetum cinerariifolium]
MDQLNPTFAAASLSHDTISAYIATQSNGSQIKYKDITQIDEDDIEEMDIKWNMALLSMRADRECRAPRSQDKGKRESYKQGPKEEETAPKALMALDGIGVIWLMRKKTMLLKNTENLNTKISKLNVELSDCESDLHNYKRGLSQIEARLVEFKEHEVEFCERIRGLEKDVEIRDNKIKYLKNELEQVKKEKESLDNKLTGFESALKDLDNLLGSQRSDKNKEGLGYNDVPPSPSLHKSIHLLRKICLGQGEGLSTPTKPHHTPSQEAQPSSHTHISTSSIPTVIPIPTVTQSEPTSLRQYTQRARIAQSSTLPPVAEEPASPIRDVSEGEACPTDSGFIADQDRETIAKSPTLPYDTAPRVTSPTAVEGSMQQTINELTALCTSLQRQHWELLVQFQAQTVELNKLNVRVKILEDNQGVISVRSADDAPIKRRRIDEKEGGIDVPTNSYSIPTAGPPTVDIHTSSDAVPTASLIIATATIVSPYSRRKGKEVMVESNTLKKHRLQEQIDAQVARELEEQQERKDKRMTKQIARDAEVARMHAEEELQEAERLKRKGFNLEQEKAKKQKTSEE